MALANPTHIATAIYLPALQSLHCTVDMPPKRVAGSHVTRCPACPPCCDTAQFDSRIVAAFY